MNERYPTLTEEQVKLSDYATREARKQDDDTPAQAGECAAFQRIVTTKVLGLARSWQPGPDAIGVGRLLRSRGLEKPPGTRAEVGDLMVWSVGHGPHGHMAMRVLGNRVAENSSAHIDRDGDARGFRPLDSLDSNYAVYRLWR